MFELNKLSIFFKMHKPLRAKENAGNEDKISFGKKYDTFLLRLKIVENGPLLGPYCYSFLIFERKTCLHLHSIYQLM